MLGGCATSPSLVKLSSPEPWSCPREQEKPRLVAQIFFGRTQPNGLAVTYYEWQQFLADTVNSRFPEGITAIDANGQYWSQKTGSIERESSKILIIVTENTSLNETKLDELVNAYKSRFHQESVLLSERVECAALL